MVFAKIHFEKKTNKKKKTLTFWWFGNINRFHQINEIAVHRWRQREICNLY